jgi:hypothetical protein
MARTDGLACGQHLCGLGMFGMQLDTGGPMSGTHFAKTQRHDPTRNTKALQGSDGRELKPHAGGQIG